ncbi:MAG: hypothetical protein AAF497_20860 [Planctomycetota bacterium]
MNNAPNDRASRLPRFSLRLLLIIITLAAGCFAVWSSFIEPYRRQAAAVKRFEKLQPPSRAQMFTFTTTAVRTSSIPGLTVQNVNNESAWHRWLVERAVGKDEFIKVSGAIMPAGTSEEDLTFILSRLPFLNTLEVSKSDVTVPAAQVLGAMPELKEVTANNSNISDEAIALISNSKSIEQLRLRGNPVSDQAVDSLGLMSSLRELYLRWTKVTPEGADRLRQKLPDCKIWHMTTG